MATKKAPPKKAPAKKSAAKKSAPTKAVAKAAKKPAKPQNLFSVAEIDEVIAALQARPGNQGLILKITPVLAGAIGTLKKGDGG